MDRTLIESIEEIGFLVSNFQGKSGIELLYNMGNPNEISEVNPNEWEILKQTTQITTFTIVKVRGIESVIVPLLSRNKSLRRLEFLGIEIEDAHLSGLVIFKELRVLKLSSSRITDLAFTYLSKLGKLEHLQVSSPQLTGAGIESLVSCKRLTNLTLRSPSLNEQSLAKLTHLQSLRRLLITGPKLSREFSKLLKKELVGCETTIATKKC